MGARSRTAAYAAGIGLFLVSLMFLASYVHRYWPAIQAMRLTAPLWLSAAVATYAISHVSTGLSWQLALRQFGQSLSISDGLKISFVAQSGKYLPGNIAQYLGRAGLAATAGVPLMTSGLVAMVEFVSAILGAGVVAALMLAIDPTPVRLLQSAIVDGAAAAGTVSAVVFVTLVGFSTWLVRKGQSGRVLVGPVVCLSVSFVLSGLSLCALLNAFGLQAIATARVIATFAVAWVLGFLVPGAPAGLGVRDAVLVAFLSGPLGPSGALTIAFAHRLLTAGVDAIAAVAGYIWLTLSKKKKSACDVLSGSRKSSG